ncbi:hypothetical protein D3C78_786950 [compost metagenome]
MKHVVQRRERTACGSGDTSSRCIGNPMFSNHFDSGFHEVLSTQFSAHSGHSQAISFVTAVAPAWGAASTPADATA